MSSSLPLAVLHLTPENHVEAAPFRLVGTPFVTRITSVLLLSACRSVTTETHVVAAPSTLEIIPWYKTFRRVTVVFWI